MNHRKWKKTLAMLAYQRADLGRVDVFHATAESEAASIRGLGFKQPIVLIPIGVDLPELAGRPAPREFKTALLLSRMHRKKGILELLDAWAKLRPEGWRLVLAGNDDGGHLAEVMAAIERHKLASMVSYVGSVFGAAKDALFRTADVFLLPTYSENFGIVVAEALSYGIPVMTTRGTPWRELETNHCGWWIETGPKALGDALPAILGTSADDLSDMGRRGRSLVERRYQWTAVADQTAQLYRWMNGTGKPPANFIT